MLGPALRSVLVAATTAAAAGCSCGAVHLAPDAADDAAGTEERDVDVVGRWQGCSDTLVFELDGAVTRSDHRRDCVARGRWTVRGRTLEVAWESTCDGGDTHWLRELVRADRGIVAVDPTTGTTSRWADDAHPIEELEIVGESGQRSFVRVVGSPGNGFGSGCYWSSDGACGGLLSCAGTILEWGYEGATLGASTTCSGACACGARLMGERDERGTITGAYRGANCEPVLTGTFIATPTLLGP